MPRYLDVTDWIPEITVYGTIDLSKTVWDDVFIRSTGSPPVKISYEDTTGYEPWYWRQFAYQSQTIPGVLAEYDPSPPAEDNTPRRRPNKQKRGSAAPAAEPDCPELDAFLAGFFCRKEREQK